MIPNEIVAERLRIAQEFQSEWFVTVATSWTNSSNFEAAERLLERNKLYFDSLSRDINDFFDMNKQRPSEFKRKLELRQRMSQIILRARPDWRFQILISGSSVNRCGSTGSDVDMCIYVPDAAWEHEGDKECSSHVLRIIQEIFLSDEDFKANLKNGAVDFIDAMVPILKCVAVFEDNFELEVDFSCTHHKFISGVHNSRLIAGFAQCDDRFAPLVMFIKEWSGANGIRDPHVRRFNSYAVTLLVIHFLQCGLPVPVLPNLQKLCGHVLPDGTEEPMFATEEDVFPQLVDFAEALPSYPVPLENEMTLGELFYLFVCYYSTLNMNANVISIKDGCISPRGRVDVPDVHRKSAVYIQDPIDKHNPGRTVDDWGTVQAIFRETREIFRRADDKVYRFPTLDDIFLRIG